MDSKLTKVYYSPEDYWKGIESSWRKGQAVAYQKSSWANLLLAQHYAHRPKVDIPKPNAVHQASLPFLQQDMLPSATKVTNSCLPLSTLLAVTKNWSWASKDPAEIAKAFHTIYKRSPLKWPQLMQVDPGREFMGSVTKKCKWQPENIYSSWVHWNSPRSSHRLTFQPHARRALVQSSALLLPSGQWLTAWVKRLSNVVSALKYEATYLTGKKRNGFSSAKSCWLPLQINSYWNAHVVWNSMSSVCIQSGSTQRLSQTLSSQLLLLINSHTPVGHTKSSIFCFVNTAVECRFETLPSDVILSLWRVLCAELHFFAVLFVNILTLQTQRNHTAAFPTLLVLWTMRSFAWLEESLMSQSKRMTLQQTLISIL